MLRATFADRCVCLVAIAMVVLPGCKKPEPESPEQYMTTFHAIEPGRAYRSGQLSPEALTWTFDKYGIKTVLNLRGHNPDKEWYQDESRVCRDKSVTLIDVAMSSRELPPPEILKSVLQAIRTAPTPILIHCESGSDRTGLVSALYRLDVLKQDRETAESELTADYGHFRSTKPCMDTFVEMYQATEEWLAKYEKDYATLKCK